MTKSLFLFASVILFRFCLDISYIYIINPIFQYEGYFVNFDLIRYILSFLVFFIFLGFLPKEIRKVSDFFCYFSIIAICTPLTSMYGLNDDLQSYPIIGYLFMLYIINFLVRINLISFDKLPKIKNGENIAIRICCVFVSFSIFWYLNAGVSLNFNLERVYEFRADNAVLSGGGVLSYINSWSMRVFNIFIISFFLYKKKWLALMVAIAVQIFFFGASAHKSILFFPILIFGTWFFLEKIKSMIFLQVSLLLSVTLIMIYTLLTNEYLIASIFIRRLFFVPANLTFTYFEYFSLNENIYWSNSLLSSFLEYKHQVSVSRLIGTYLGKPETAANNGFISSGYAHFSFFGIVLYSIIVGFILRFLNDICKNSFPIWLSISLTMVPVSILLLSSDLFTTLLTHGLLINLFLLFFCRVEKK